MSLSVFSDASLPGTIGSGDPRLTARGSTDRLQEILDPVFGALYPYIELHSYYSNLTSDQFGNILRNLLEGNYAYMFTGPGEGNCLEILSRNFTERGGELGDEREEWINDLNNCLIYYLELEETSYVPIIDAMGLAN